MCKTYIATRQTPLGVQGWADLLKALHLANNDTRLEASFAEQLGFEKLPEQEDRPDDDFIPIGAKLEPKPQQPEPATDQSSIFHPYYLHSLQTVVSSAEWLAAAPDNSAELGGLTQQDQGPWRAKHTPPPAYAHSAMDPVMAKTSATGGCYSCRRTGYAFVDQTHCSGGGAAGIAAPQA